ncbi:hypothetical protein SLEP1_g11293 [Rubroshorea leprosula]|uniref:Uncharacterized protein n=1 Tax=Rubroshorea leprosula TaxID=152421 RepID=A0AAV5IGM4_9ROSI|nr:hypothetical protein SLEP1_g11293 [Rubroshorea leprosula]
METCYDQDQEEVQGSHYPEEFVSLQILKSFPIFVLKYLFEIGEEKAKAEVKVELNSRSRGVGGGAGEVEQNIFKVLDFCPETKMKSKASSSASTLSLRPSVDRSGARQVVCDHELAAWLHVSTSELNPRRSKVVVEQSVSVEWTAKKECQKK